MLVRQEVADTNHETISSYELMRLRSSKVKLETLRAKRKSQNDKEYAKLTSDTAGRLGPDALGVVVCGGLGGAGAGRQGPLQLLLLGQLHAAPVLLLQLADQLLLVAPQRRQLVSALARPRPRLLQQRQVRVLLADGRQQRLLPVQTRP